MVVWGGLTNSWEKKGSERQRRKGKIYPFECRVPRIARRDKKAFLTDQYKAIEENNTMGKMRDLLKKSEIPREHFIHNGHNKGQNSMDLIKAHDIKKRWQEYTEELYKNDLSDRDNHNGVITHLEPDIYVCVYMYIYTHIISLLSLPPLHLIL